MFEDFPIYSNGTKPEALQDWDFSAEVERSANRVADATVGRIMERQRLYEHRVSVYTAVAAAEGASRKVVPVPTPSPSGIGRRTEQGPTTAAGGVGGRGGSGRRPPAANAEFPDDWDEPMVIAGNKMPFVKRNFPTKLTDGELDHVLAEHLSTQDSRKTLLPRGWGNDRDTISGKLERVLQEAMNHPIRTNVTHSSVVIDCLFEGKKFRVVLHNSAIPGVMTIHPVR